MGLEKQTDMRVLGRKPLAIQSSDAPQQPLASSQEDEDGGFWLLCPPLGDELGASGMEHSLVP